MQNRRKYRNFGQKFKLNMQNHNAVEVKITFLALFFCQKSDYFFEFFAPAENYKKVVSIGLELILRSKFTFFVAVKKVKKAVSVGLVYLCSSKISPEVLTVLDLNNKTVYYYHDSMSDIMRIVNTVRIWYASVESWREVKNTLHIYEIFLR